MPIEKTPARLILADLELPYSAQGWLSHYRLPKNRTPLWRHMHHKRWVYVWIDGGDWILGLAVIDLNYAAKCFVYLAQKGLSQPLLQYNQLFSQPSAVDITVSEAQKITARFRNTAIDIDLQIDSQGALELNVSGKGFEIYAQALPPAMSPLVAANRLTQGDVNLTQKAMYSQAKIQIKHGNQILRAEDATLSLDLTDGFLPHQTAWYWASLNGQSVSGQHLALNLVQGFNGACECALWSELNQGIPQLLGEGQFERGETWTIQSTCQGVNLRFRPWSTFSQRLNWGPINSDFQQLYGSYSGWMQAGDQRLELKDVHGIAEYQRVNW